MFRDLFLAALLPVASPLQQDVKPVPEYARVEPDTIYRLAVDPEEYPDKDFVYLLDDGVLVFEPDGRGRTTYHQVLQILTQDGAERWGELRYSYLKERENLIINWVRVVTPAGELIAEGPSHEQESTVPVSTQYPVYTDRVVHRLSIGGLEPGVLLDVSRTTETLDPILEGNFSSSWRVNPPAPTLRSRLVLDVPVSFEPHVRELNLNFERRVLERDGRHAYVWAASDVTPPEPEPFTSPPDNGIMTVDVTGDIDWGDVARFYADLARDRYNLTPEIVAELDETVASAETFDDTLRALHRWVTKDFRYVSLSLGLGGYQPRTPAEVFESKLGDCKDKATLFIALAQHLGAVAYPVLLHQGGMADSVLPSLGQFNHVIAAVERPDGYLFLDLTAELVPYGSIPLASQGGFALVVHPDGAAEKLVLPTDPPERNRSDFVLNGEITAAGEFSGTYTETRRGAEGYRLRRMAESLNQLSDREREQMIRRMANSIYRGARGEGLEVFDPSDPGAEPHLSLTLHVSSATRESGGSHILTLPIPNFAAPSLIAELQAEARRYAIDVEEIFGPVQRTWVYEAVLPPGWRAEIPDAVTAESQFGSYSASYTQQDRTLRVQRSVKGSRGTEPPEAVHQLIDWLKAISEDDREYILLTAPEQQR